MQNSEHSFGEKIIEISVEIFIIVFAVSLSIWLHGWSEHRHQQQEVTEFLTDLKDDLKKDMKNMEKGKGEFVSTAKQYTWLENLSKKQIDSTATAKENIGMSFNFTTRKTSSGNYEGFKSSGKIGFVENKKLKKLILEYYQETMPGLEESEKYYNSHMSKMVELAIHNRDKDKMFLDPVVKRLFNIAIQSANGNITTYDSAIKQVKEIIGEIDKKVKE